LVPQARFLEFLAENASKYPECRIIMRANAEQLINENGEVNGVRYLAGDGMHEVRAALTVGADGRFSKIRHLAGFEPVRTSAPMDILWFRLPHIPGDLPEAENRLLGGFGVGRVLVVFDRGEYWQVGFVFPKGHYQDLRAAGLDVFRRSLVEIEPSFAEHVKTITDWHQCSLLSVESSRCPRWYKPGLLLIGDAAHVMSPIGGVGINYAIQDAVEATNLLSSPLKSGTLQVGDLARLQRKREWPTKVIQSAQSVMQNRILANVLQSQTADSFKIPWAVSAFFAIPVLRDIPARVLAFGVTRVRLNKEAVAGRSN
jgi:2-polyprenyl-6-methoxyphenol hydroxylase-like FAD-dependent oxidoreductase